MSADWRWFLFFAEGAACFDASPLTMMVPSGPVGQLSGSPVLRREHERAQK